MAERRQKKVYKGYTTNNNATLVRGGKEYFDLLIQLIERAVDTIHLQTYIFDDDITGVRVIDALKQAAQKKIKVYLMVDGYASQRISKKTIADIQSSGINFRFFEPLLKSRRFYFGRRLHHKIFVADSSYALVSGINITDRYNDLPGRPAWLDFGVFVEGDIAFELCKVCWKTWKGFPSRTRNFPCAENLFVMDSKNSSLVRIRRNDWVRTKTQVSQSYVEMLATAKSHVTILCSYFLPGIIIRNQLIQTARRGVKIKLILAGLSDVKIAKWAERFIYSWLLKNKIEIFEYQGNVLHGKLSTCDNEWLTIGSYNINNISAYASIELNLDIKNPVFTSHVEDLLNEIINNDCVQVTETNFAKSSNIFRRFARWFSYQTIKFLFYVFTFYFRQRA